MSDTAPRVLITGATNGIGEATALALAQQGAEVIIHGRSAEKIVATQSRLQRQSAAPVYHLQADLSSQTEIRAMVEDFYRQFDRLDILINNAGAVFMERQLSADGIEMTFALNHLSYFLLSHLLIPALHQAPAGRIVNVTSATHKMTHMHWDNLQLDKGYHGLRAYTQSKLANVLFTYELARRLAHSLITVNCLHPGGVRTGIGLNNRILVRIFMRFISRGWRSPEEGAQTSVYLATAPALAGLTGQYFEDQQAVPSSAASYNEDDARRLWEISAQMTKLTERESLSPK